MCRPRVRNGTTFPQRVPYLFPPGWATVSNLAKSFVLSVHTVEKRMHSIRTDPFRVLVMPDDFAQSYSDLGCMFVSFPLGTGPGSLSESLDNPAIFQDGTHSGF